jgi:5-methylcytosine-specific restriction endonuclease McrA
LANWHDSNDWKKARAYAKEVLDPTCVTCGLDLSGGGGEWTIDHIVPPGDGKPNHDISNLQSMCRECNGRKGDRSLVRVAWNSGRW